MADAEKTKRSRKKLPDQQEQERIKREVQAAQREQQKKNRARSIGSMGGYTPADQEPEAVAAQPVNDLDVAAAAAKVIMPEAPAAPLATDGEQYSLFGELTPEEKLQANVEVLSEALEEEAYAIANDPLADEFDALYADQLESLKTAYSNISAGLKRLRSFLKSPEFQRLIKAFSDFSEWVRGANPQRTLSDFLFLTSVIETYQPILPFFLEEIEQLKQEPGRENLSLQDFIRDTDENGQPIVSLFEIAAKAAAEKAAAAKTAEEAAAIEKSLEQLPKLAAAKHIMINNPLMNKLQQSDAINAGAFDLTVINAKERQPETTAYTMVTYDAGETGEALTALHLSEYERLVSDAVITLWERAAKSNCDPVFTPDMIFREMPGGSDKPSPQQRGAIVNTIERLRHLHIFLDATEEMQRRGVIGDGETWKIDDFYLSVRRIENVKVKGGGRQANYAYRVTIEPIMLTYSNITKQLITIPTKYLTIRKVKQGQPSGELIAMTPERQAMTGYLVRRIEVMKYDYKRAIEKKRKHDAKRRRDASIEEKPLAAFREQRDTILFETLFKETETVTADRKQTMLNRNFCFDVLDYEVAVGNIKGYKKQQKGRSITGIEILL